MTFPDKTPQSAAVLYDANGDAVSVDGSSRLEVSLPPAVPPAGTDPVVRTSISNVGGGAGSTVDDFYTITNTKTLTISDFLAGAESGKAAKVELFEDASGTGSPLVAITIPAYVNGNNFSTPINVDYVGDGTRRILLRLTKLDGGGSPEIAGQWRGFEA